MIGPAGAGKTSVLAQWRAKLLDRSMIAAWYTASERDRDPSVFLQMLARAFHAAGVDMSSEGVLDALDVDPTVTLDAILLALEHQDRAVTLIIDEMKGSKRPT